MTSCGPFREKQQGTILIEGLFAIVIFSVGVLALVGMQANAVKLAGDAKLRADAAYLANQIISQMWADRSHLDDYRLNDDVSGCANFSDTSLSGTGQGIDNVNSWLGVTSRAGTVFGMLPGAKAQITVETGTNVVTVTVCWKTPQETDYHNFVSTALVSG